MKKTKRSLLFSGLALMMSALLLAGTTFAWFTDSVTNKGNTIQAGNLAVTFQYRDLNDANAWQPVPDAADEAGALFTDQLWEPGYSYGYDFKVSNPTANRTGVLAFNYQLQVSNIQTTSTSGADIAKVLDVYVTTNIKATDLSDYTYVGTLDELRTGKVVFNSDKVMQGGFEDVFSVVIKMQDSAQNEYQNCGVTFDLNLLAKQAPYEEDGFGNPNYDENTGYAVEVTDSNPDTVIEAAKNLQNGETLVLGTDVTLPAYVSGQPRKTIRFDSPITATMDFGGKTVTGYNGNISLVATNGADITLTNGTLTAENGTYCTIGADGGNVTVDGLYLKNTTPNGNSVKVWANSVVNLNNVTSTSVYGGAIEVTGGMVNVNGGTFTQTGYYDWNSGIGAVSYGGVLNIYDIKAVSENYCLYAYNSGGTINVYGGSFTATGENGGKGVAIQVDSSTVSGQPGVVNVYGGSFDGAIHVGSPNADLNIEAGTFANTGLTLEQFEAYVAEGSSVAEVNGSYVVTAG